MCDEINRFAIEKQQILGKSILFNQQESARSLKIGLINLMPQKEVTEEQFFRLLSSSGHPVEVKLIKMATYQSTTTDKVHLEKYYHTLSEIKDESFDGLIITGAPIETIPFEEVSYWEELTDVMRWSQATDTSTLNICWGAQAALYVHHGIEKILYQEKLSGLFLQSAKVTHPLMTDFPATFSYPQSRHTGIDLTKINSKDFEVIAQSPILGPTILTSNSNQNIYVLGHLEYDTNTLKREYERDVARKLAPKLPENYFEKDDVNQPIVNNWEPYAQLFYQNWLTSLDQRTGV